MIVAAGARVPAHRIGWLFAFDWDREAMQRLGGRDGPRRFDHAGFDLFSFPSSLALAGFDLERFAERQAARGRRLGWRAVVSHHEQFGALAAALVAERLGLPGASPESIVAAQHKLHARAVLAQVAPEANLRHQALEPGYDAPVPDGLAYPSFAKPVKGAFSVLARGVASHADLHALTRFGRIERMLMHKLIEPFERVRRARLAQAGSAHRMLVEEAVPAHTPQYNLDGWVQDGSVHALGVVDAVMYPGTQAFMRWERPSRLEDTVQQRALDLARRFLCAIGYRHGFFNLEFFYDANHDRLSVIEFNPRLASQFSDLYRRVHGVDAHAMAVALALGEDPRSVPRCEPSAAIAASLVYRVLDSAGSVPPPPARDARALLCNRFPDSLLLCFTKSALAVARDFRWTGSHRYGIVHLGAPDREQLRLRCMEASTLLGWPASPYSDQLDVALDGAPRDGLPIGTSAEAAQA